VTIPAAETVTHFQFAEDEVAVGDGIFANVDVGGLHGSGSTTNGPELERAIGWYRAALHTTSEDNLLNISGIQYLYEIRNSSENSNRSRKQDGKRSELSKKP
jgi:hypothetical protein